MPIVTMPQLGESVTEGTVLRWLKQPGEPVALDEPLCEIETEKVNVELPSPYEGVMGRQLAAQGETVPVGAPLCEILSVRTEAGVEEQAELVAAAPSAEPASVAKRPSESPTSPAGDRRQRYTPAVLRLARLHGIDLEQLRGTGLGGRVTRKDVEAFLAAREPAGAATPLVAPQAETRPSAATAASAYEVVPLSATRRTIAERLTRAAREVPQAWTMVEVDVTELLRVRERIAQRLGRHLTLLPFFARAVCRALGDHPNLNARFEDGELRRYRDVNLGVAVAAPTGLVVPVIHRAQEFAIEGLARVLDELVERARAGKLRLEDVEGGTFTVNNTGAFGSVASRPILNAPEVAIVTLERVTRRPVVIGEDGIAIRSMVNVCLTFDHRALDGHEAGAFLASLKSVLESPSEM